MDFDIYTVFLSILVFILYLIALALYKYLKTHNCIPNAGEIADIRAGMTEMMEKGLRHDETLKDIQTKIDIHNHRKFTI